MPAPLWTINSCETLPEEADVVVIGAGIVGTSAAYFLAKRGLKVALVEKGRVGSEQSSRNWGWCRQQNRDMRELPLSTKSLELWEAISQDLNIDLGFKRSGLLYLSNNEEEIAGWARWRDLAKEQGVTTQVLSSREATQHGIKTGRRWKGGVFSQSDGIADPARAAPLIASGIRKYGGTIHQFCAARGLEIESNRVTGVVTELGTIKTKRVVLAAGAWASVFCKQIGINFPQVAVRSSVLSLMPSQQDMPDAIHTSEISITLRGDGGRTLAISGSGNVDPTMAMLRYAINFVPMFTKRWHVLSPGNLSAWRLGHEYRRKWALDKPTPMEHTRVLDPKPSAASIEETLMRARRLFPALTTVPVQTAWAGFIDSTPDGIPVIDSTVGPEGFVLAAGFSGHGFGIGPGAGHLIAEIVGGDEPSLEYKQYRLARLQRSVWGKVSDF
ncbi:FAD-binding oxidoreductase [Brucella sp. H1_1004]|uniref:NAD(P)/FAD-dependent oxidoreductase n=1 Tax=Brucella sp. H1_1004 TaxID=3110109 RepID=UPI0039B47031